jgi:hypothetical protein
MASQQRLYPYQHPSATSVQDSPHVASIYDLPDPTKQPYWAHPLSVRSEARFLAELPEYTEHKSIISKLDESPVSIQQGQHDELDFSELVSEVTRRPDSLNGSDDLYIFTPDGFEE